MSASRTRTRPATNASSRVIPPGIVKSMYDINKTYGAGTVRFGNQPPRLNHVPTGCFIIDLALHGGLPEGYPAQAYGYHSTGKSTFYLHAVKGYQMKYPDRYVAWNDPEGLYDPVWAEALGVDTERLIYADPDTGEEAVNICEDWFRNKDIGAVVLDSIPSCVSMEIIEKAAEDKTMAKLAQLMSNLCSKWTMAANDMRRQHNHFCSFWMVNQLRKNPGVMFGSPLYTPGGIQVNHIPLIKLWLKLGKTVMEKDEWGNEIPGFNEQTFKLEKTKHTSIEEGAFQLIRNANNARGVPQGHFDNVHQILTFGKKMGFVTGGGSTWRCLTGENPRKTFGKLSDIEAWLQESVEERDTLARSIIALNRSRSGRSALPPDGYLVSHHGRLVELTS